MEAYGMGRSHSVAGAGLGAFAAAHGGVGYYPHNLVLELFSESGGVGVGLLAIMVAVFLREAWRARQRLHALSFAAWMLLLVAAQFSGDLYDSRGVFLLPLFALLREPAEAAQRTSIAQTEQVATGSPLRLDRVWSRLGQPLGPQPGALGTGPRVEGAERRVRGVLAPSLRRHSHEGKRS